MTAQQALDIDDEGGGLEGEDEQELALQEEKRKSKTRLRRDATCNFGFELKWVKVFVTSA